jgi:limonene-1,2-epoxide hydrolase
MIDLTMASNGNERLALTILKAMEDRTLLETVARICTEDFVWENSGLPTIHGRAALEAHAASGGFAQLIPILAGMRSFSADVLHIASSGDVVFTERIDHHWDAEGRDLMTPHIAGVIEVRDGRICALRDFYDTACYSQQPTAPDPRQALAPS